MFISYSSGDQARALMLADRLQGEGVAVWLDRRSIPAGANWDAEIVEAIKRSMLVTVLVSPKAMKSKNVRQELRLALQYDKPILPLLLAPTDFPSEVEYVLAGRQWVEVLDRPEDDWLPRVLAAALRLA